LILHCHNRRKIRLQAQEDSEAAVAAQISRGCIKEPIKGDNPPDYEQPPSYNEAICELKWIEVVANEKKLRENNKKSKTSKSEKNSLSENDSNCESNTLRKEIKCEAPLEDVQCYM
jgi:hypothetical protein